MDTQPANAHNPLVTRRPITPIVRRLAPAAGVLLCLPIVLGLGLQPDDPAPVSEPTSQQTNGQAVEDETLTEAVVTLHSGRQITGFLIENTAESVVIRINGIDTTFPRSRVAALRVLPPVEERYRSLRDAVDDDDIRARMALVEWLRTRRAYTLALQELDGILEIEPGNADARTVRDWIRAHIELNSRSQRERPEPSPDRTIDRHPVPALTEEQINRIRIFEIDLDTPTRVHVPEETMRTLMVRFPRAFPVDVDEREEILDADPIEQLRILFELRARDLYDTVTVREDPPSMARFKSRVHGSGGWLVNACASNRCHGGAEAGRLRLINRRPNSDETAYTNFFILENFRLADGTRLINHEEPARSPLLHLALPRKASLYPHPDVDPRKQNQEWRHVFRSTSDRRFRETAEWIGSLYRPRPNYGIDYPPTPADDEDEPNAEQDPPETP